MSNPNRDDWKTPIMRGTFSPSYGLVSRSARTIAARFQSKETQPVTEEWIIPDMGPAPAGGLSSNSADNPPEAPSSAISAPESYTTPDWATPIDEGFIHPEGYTTKVVGIDSPLASRLADMGLPPYAPKHTIRIPTPKGDTKLGTEERGVNTSTPTPGPPPNTSSKEADVKTSPSEPEPPQNTGSQRSVGTQTCVKTIPPPGDLSPPKSAYLTNRAMKFDDAVENISDGHSEPGAFITEEPKRPSIHRPLAPASILGLVQEIKVPENIALGLDEHEMPAVPPSVPPDTPKKDKGVTECKIRTPPPSLGPPLNSPSKGLSTDGTLPPPPNPGLPPDLPRKGLSTDETPPPPPSPGLPPNSPRKGSSTDGTPPSPPSVPLSTPSEQAPAPECCVKRARSSTGPALDSPSKQLFKDGTPPPPPSPPLNTPVKRDALITDFFAKLAKHPSSPQFPSPSPGTTTREFPKGGGGGGTPPPPSPPPNTPSKKLAKEPSHPPSPRSPPNTPSMKLDEGGGGGETLAPPFPPPNTPSKHLARYPSTSSSPSPLPNTTCEEFSESRDNGEASPAASPSPNKPLRKLSRPDTSSLSLVIPNHDEEQLNPTDPKQLTSGYRKPSLVDYTSDDDYPSPDPGSDSPITPLWLEMKNMVDEFISKTEEEEVNSNIAKRPESIPLPSSEPTSPATEVQSPNLSLTPRVLASLEETKISVRMAEQGRARDGLKRGAGLRNRGAEEASSQLFHTSDAESNSSIADEVQKMARCLTVWEEGAISAGEVETARDRGQKALMRKNAAGMQAARDSWNYEDHQNTPQAIGSLSHIHPDNIEYPLNNPQVVEKHVQANGEIRDTTVYFSREKLEIDVSLIYQTRGSAMSQVPQWKKEFKLLSLPARNLKNHGQNHN